MSKATTFITTILIAFSMITPLAFASPYKAIQKMRAGESADLALAYEKASLKKMAPVKQTVQSQYASAVSKTTPLPGTNHPKPTQRGKIRNLTSQDHGGWSSTHGTLAGPDGQPLDLTIEVDAWGSGEIYLEGDSGLIYEATLNQDRMQIVSHEEDGTVSEVWYRPGGDLLDFLDRKAENAGSGATPRRLQGMKLHETARNAVFEVAQTAGGAFSSLAERFETAETVYANWKEATTSEREMVRYATFPVPIEPNNPPVSQCTYPDEKTAVATENTLKILKVADLTVRSAKVKVSAFCEDQGGCLKAESKVDFGSVASQEDDGSFGCPQDGTEISGEEFRVNVLTFEGSAEVGRACARNYDRTDVAEAFTAEIEVDGVVEASIKGTAATGDGVAGRSHIQGRAVVCYEDDPWFDDVQDVMLSGSAQSSLE